MVESNEANQTNTFTFVCKSAKVNKVLDKGTGTVSNIVAW